MDNKAGPTGEYPEGKLNKDDEGELKIIFREEKGNLIVEFGKPVEWIGFPPEQAIGFAWTLEQRAMEMLGRTPG